MSAEACRLATDAVFAGGGEMGARCRTVDWAATPLGSSDRWPAALRYSVSLALSNSFPMVVLWGPELVQVYNDGYRALMGGRHPAGLGQPTRASWPEAWHINAPIYEQVLRGETVYREDALIPRTRLGALEDAWFTLSYSPIRTDGDGEVGDRVGGVLVTVMETTSTVVARHALEVAAAAAEHRAAEFAAVIESMSDAVYVGSAEGITFANGPALAQLGYATREALNRHIGTLAQEIQTRDAATGARLPVEREPFARALGGESVTQDVVVRHRGTGADRIVRCAAAPVAIGGVVVAAVAVNTDVTEQRAAEAERALLLAAEQQARERLERLQSLAEALAPALDPVGVAERTLDTAVGALGAKLGSVGLLDEDGATFELAATFGMPAEDVARWRRFPNAGDRPWTRVAASGQPIFVTSPEAFRAFADLGDTPARLGLCAEYAVPLVTAADQVLGVVGLSFAAERAVSEDDRRLLDTLARQAAQALERARLFAAAHAARTEAEHQRHVADEANATKAQFLATMSHELRTPLNAIGGYVQLLEMGVHGPVTDAQAEALARMQRSQHHLLGLVNAVLDYARIEAGRVAYDIAPMPLAEALAGVEALVAPQARAKGLSLDVAPCTEAALAVLADAAKLRQVLLNLLSNAVKFTRGGGRVAVTCAGDDEVVRVCVTDTGRGIAPEQLARAFEPFVQVGRALTSSDEGAGLGLAISRDLARGMGGDVMAESEPGVGSTFTLVLPRAGMPTALTRPAA